MAITVDITGTGGILGVPSNLTSYSVQEAITPLDASLGGPGVGTVTFGATADDDSVLLLDNAIVLTDTDRGIALGTVRNPSSNDLALTVTADSLLSVLNSIQSPAPFTGTLGGAISYYMGLVGLDLHFRVSTSLSPLVVVLPGVTDVLLNTLSQLCIAYQMEMSVVNDKIIFRPARLSTATVTSKKANNWTIDRGAPALSVSIYYYDWTWDTEGLIYPSTLETPRSGFQVDIGETLEPTRIQVAASLSSVNQPIAVDFLGPSFAGGAGSYVVLGSDLLPIPHAEWDAKGGRVTVQVDPTDSTYIVINVTGMTVRNDPRAPYTVGIISDGATSRSAFFISGTGAISAKKLLIVNTGATNTLAPSPAPIDNPNISTLAQALTAIQKTVLRYSGVNYSISADAVSVMGNGTESYPGNLAAFDSTFLGQKMSALDARGWKFSDFDAFFLITVSRAGQLFGNTGGVRIPYIDSWFRIDSATITESATSYVATIDTLWDDYNTIWSGAKLSAWDTALSGHKLRDWDIRPLWRTA